MLTCVEYGEFEYTYERIYDENGNLIREIYTEDDGSQEFCDYSYDANGNRVKEVYYDEDGIMGTYDYTYDANGNAIKTVRTDDEGVQESVETQYALVYIPFEIPAGTKYILDGFFDVI